MKKYKPGSPDWLNIARELQSMSQTGLTFATNEYEKARYERIKELASEIVEKHTSYDQETISRYFTLQPGYATPKVDVRGAVISDGKILLVKEKADGRWCMPGGWADVGDIPSEMVAREVVEESGFVVKPIKVIGVYDANRGGEPEEFFHAYKIVFLCEIIGGKASASYETSDVDFFEFDNLPVLSSQRTNERHLDEVKKHLDDTNRETYFD